MKTPEEEHPVYMANAGEISLKDMQRLWDSVKGGTVIKVKDPMAIQKIHTYKAVDRMYSALGGRPSLNDRIALWVVKHVSTMYCAYLFVGIGVGAIVGTLFNWQIGILCGVFSSQFIQLVLLPIIMVGQDLLQKQSSEHHERHGEKLDELLRHHWAKAKGQTPYDRDKLKQALIENRSRRKTGSGQEYWDSVCDAVEKAANLYPRKEAL